MKSLVIQAFFVMEVGLRLCVHRLYFFVNDNAMWSPGCHQCSHRRCLCASVTRHLSTMCCRNWMDFALVVFSLLELSLSWSAGKNGNGTIMYLMLGLLKLLSRPCDVIVLWNGRAELRVRRVFRLFKFAPILRSLRVITAFRAACFYVIAMLRGWLPDYLRVKQSWCEPGAGHDDGKLSILHCSYVLELGAAPLPRLHEQLGSTGHSAARGRNECGSSGNIP